MFKLFTFPEKLQALLLKVVGILAGIAICVLMAWAVIKMVQAKNDHIVDLNKQLTTSQNANKQLKEELNKKQLSDNAGENVVADVKQSLDKQEAAKADTIQYVERKVVEIREKYNQLPATPDNDAKKAADISLERVKGLWMTYCLQDTTNEACKNKE